ncbi:GNAT family N-acetyltransferase [Streptomyces sp. ME01-24h]|nr:GNAT family N-acetyltransferase [Streptomyces sp. ME19-03-3]MDX3214318.1 GNAT family N-acetyltransferase [Streptomyces sp. ME02-6991-2B]MDX3353116.1 GNAT family N-acetyltransferase [Streptomyces sp. ME01-24h]
MSDVNVTDATGARRYEALVDGTLAGFATYIRTPEMIAFLHTEVDPDFEGRGVGSAIARRALDEARERGQSVLAACPFISRWIAHHPEYGDLVYQPRSVVSD